MDNLYIIAGLGNPGRKYEGTRHNVGFDAIDCLSQQHGIKVSKIKFKALLGEGFISNKKVILVKPQTYMNLSGESIRDILDWYKVSPDHLIVIFDDVDIPFGEIRVKRKGSAGTHNGMKSIIYQLKDDNFPRVKIGIGKPPEEWELSDFVLSGFSREERKIINDSIEKAARAVTTIIEDGIDAAMNLFN